MALAIVVLEVCWLTLFVAYGCVARVVAGSTFSPLGQLSTRVVTPLPHVEPKIVPGPPKRFAELLGAIMSVAGAAAASA